MTVIAFSGHRPDKLPDKETGYILPNPTYIYVCQQLERHLTDLKPTKAISGMALGVDQWAANICNKLKIPLIAAIPFEGQEKMWPEKSKKVYQSLLQKASEKIVVCEGGYSAYKMQLRNEWMVNHCDILLAVWDGSKGGTGNCVDYAMKKMGQERIVIINPKQI
jgi:uncharacterized phage-like protein YoqJ